MEEIKTVPFITDIPESTISLEINATIFVDGELQRATMRIDDAGTIRKQMIKGKEYDDEKHEFTVFEEVVFRVKNISEIVEFMPDDPDYDNTKFGVKIIMTNGNEYYAMDWSIDEILQLIERAS